MKLSAAIPKLLALPQLILGGRKNRPTRATLLGLCGWVLLLLVSVPTAGWAQTGRGFVAVEAYVGLARVVYVGQIAEIQLIEYDKPQSSIQKLGKPYRLVFEVSETIRGDAVERLELVLSLQSTHFLEYLREHSVEVMLVGGPADLAGLPRPEVGIEVQGQSVDENERYHFRLLDPVKVSESGSEDAIASQLNAMYDSCRMFTIKLEVVEGRQAILQKARAFAKDNTKQLSAVTLRVPNEFGALCGNPNAFCRITLPICPATQKTLTAIQDDPGIILRRVKTQDEEFQRSILLTETQKGLALFPQSDGK